MMPKKSVQVALGGVFASLCLLLMFLSSVLPFTSFAMPMLAGAMLMAVVIENGEKTAWLVFIAVSLLSLFIVADIDAKLLFIAFFGYYPIIRSKFERIPQKPRRILFKLLLFNSTMIAGYFASLYLFGLDELAKDSEFIGKYLPAAMLAGLNVTFLMYDFLLAKAIAFYICSFKPVFLRR